MAELYRWQGVNRNGGAVAGATTIEPQHLPAIVKDRFAHGWRSLTVTRQGIEVAHIGRDPAKPKVRTWWAEGGD